MEEGRCPCYASRVPFRFTHHVLTPSTSHESSGLPMEGSWDGLDPNPDTALFQMSTSSICVVFRSIAQSNYTMLQAKPEDERFILGILFGL